jgi:hypothetical protein
MTLEEIIERAVEDFDRGDTAWIGGNGPQRANRIARIKAETREACRRAVREALLWSGDQMPAGVCKTKLCALAATLKDKP